MSIPLTKQANVAIDIAGAVADGLWDENDGPMENLFRLIENYKIIFGGGPLSILLIVLKGFGIGPSQIGRWIDEQNGFKTINDVVGMNQEAVAQKIAQKIESVAGDQAGADQHVHDGAELGKTSDFSDGVFKYGRKSHRITGPGLLERLFGRRRSHDYDYTRIGKAGLFTVALAWLTKSLMSTESVLAKILRGGIAGLTDHVKDDDKAGNQSQAKPAPTKKTPKMQLEDTIDQILGEP